MIKIKYSKEKLEEAVKSCESFSAVVRYLGIPFTTSNHRHISSRIKKFSIDTSHFTGRKANKGGSKRIFAADILVLDRSNGHREYASVLRRALKELGIEEKCTECNQTSTWNGKPLTLQIDHINGNGLDNRLENLRFLCPNCHSQTANFGVKNSKPS